MAACCFNPALAGTIEVDAQRDANGEAVKVQVRMSLPFKHSEVWDVLNDYEHMPRFVSDIQETELIESNSDFKRVRIQGGPTWLFMHFPVAVVMDVKYLSDKHVSLESRSGNLGVKGDVYLQAQPDNRGTRVIYIAYLRPAFWLPPLIGPYLIATKIREEFEGKVAEMHRRYDARQANL